MQEELKALEEEADKLLQAQEIQSPAEAAPEDSTEEDRAESDARSIHISNCDYSATDKDLEEHFSPCGEIARVMIKKHKFTKKPMGYAYLEFTDKDSVELALGLHESLFKGRQISVAKKRTNIAGFNQGRGGGGRGRGGGRRGRGGRGRAFYGGYRGGRRGRGYRPY
eukprot:gene18099-28068_t